MTPKTDPELQSRPTSRLHEAAAWAGRRSLHTGRPASRDERPHDLADVADGVTVRVGVFDIVLW